MLAANPIYSLTIVGAPTFTTTSPLPGGIVGVPYSQQIVVSGGVPPFQYAVSGGVPGLVFAAAAS